MLRGLATLGDIRPELLLRCRDFSIFFPSFRGHCISFYIHSFLLTFSEALFCLLFLFQCADDRGPLVQEFHSSCGHTEWCVNFPRGNVVCSCVPNFACRGLDCNNNKLIVEVHQFYFVQQTKLSREGEWYFVFLLFKSFLFLDCTLSIS